MSARSSITALNEAPSTSHALPPALEQEIADDEQRIEKYGADDINEPEPKDHPLAFLSAPKDPNMVTWDGPDDPNNPQNFSTFRKWLVTFVCVLTTINVYVVAHFNWPSLI